MLHCGTNDLWQDICAAEIGKKIIELVVFCKSDNSNILVSGIVLCCDELNPKVTQVHIYLKNEFKNGNICFINNSNINPWYNCNKKGIHLHKSGTNRLLKNMLFALSKFGY